tara:strand:- start:11560 stop:11925 length:366 start_codon:yes stop_codon:yes gene_type:complete
MGDRTMRYLMLAGAFVVLAGCGSGVMVSMVTTQESLSRTVDESNARDYLPLEIGMTWSFGDRGLPVQIGNPIQTTAGSAYSVEGFFHQERMVRKTDDNKVMELAGDRWRLLVNFDAPEKAS